MKIYSFKNILSFKLSIGIAVFAVALSPLSANAQSASECAMYASNRTAHKVTGWEKSLVNRSRNLSNFYWTPQTFYTHGSHRTSKGARAVAPGCVGGPRQCAKAKFVPLPKNDRINLSTSTSDTTQSRESCSAMMSCYKTEVAVYADYSLRPNRVQNLSVKAQVYTKAK